MTTAPDEPETTRGTAAAPRIAVVGAGLIGRKHAALVARHARLSAIVDPDPASQAVAGEHGVPLFDEIARCLAEATPDGVIVATPNQLHVPHALACIAADIPVLVEKPLADTTEGARRIVEAAETAGVPVLVGHHRRHNPIIAAAKDAIAAGRLGEIVTVDAKFWLYKPDDYFAPAWRRSAGAGPVLINLIHDVDLLRHLVGEIARVTAIQSSRVRGHAVEDTAAVLLEFANGALGTVSVSDTVVAPWSWEFSSAENPAYPHVPVTAYAIGGTHGALSVPDLRLYAHPGPRGWWEPLTVEALAVVPEDPLVRQIRHFAEVIRGEARPLVSAREGMRTLAVVDAVKRAAQTGTPQDVA